MSTNPITTALNFLHCSSLSISAIILSVLHPQAPGWENDPCIANIRNKFIKDLQDNLFLILDSFSTHPYTYSKTKDWATMAAKTIYCKELVALMDDGTLHFNAHQATAARLQQFSIQKLAMNMENKAPHLWEMFDSLLDAHPEMSRYCKRYMAQKSKKRPHHHIDGDISDNSNQHDYDVCDGEREGEDDEYWTELDVLEELEGMALPGSNTGAHATRAPRSKRESLQVIVSNTLVTKG